MTISSDIFNLRLESSEDKETVFLDGLFGTDTYRIYLFPVEMGNICNNQQLLVCASSETNIRH